MTNENCIDFSEDIASIYDETRPFDGDGQNHVLNEVCSRLITSFGSNEIIDILDLGAGTGRLTLPLARIYHLLRQMDPNIPLLRITCVERSEAMMAKLKEKAESFSSTAVELAFDETLDIRDLRSSDNKYDACIAHWIFHVIYDWRVAIYAVDNVLKTTGLVFLFEERGDLYDVIDGDLRGVKKSPAKNLWWQYHLLRTDLLDDFYEPGSLLPPRFRLGTMVVDDRFEHMFRALGWTKLDRLSQVDRWETPFKVKDLIEKVIRQRAFTNMRLVRNDKASKMAYSEIADELTRRFRKQEGEVQIEYNYTWHCETRFTGVVLSKPTRPSLPLPANSVLLSVIRETLGRRTHRRGEIHLNSDVLWSRLFTQVWERLNKRGISKSPLAVLGRRSKQIMAVLAQAPFIGCDDQTNGDTDTLILSKKNSLDNKNLQLAWQLLTRAIETNIPLEIVFNPNKNTKHRNRLKLHPIIHRLVINIRAQGLLAELPILPDDCVTISDIPDESWNLVADLVNVENTNDAISDLLHKSRKSGVLPLHDRNSDSSYFLMALSVLAQCPSSSTFYAFPFRTLSDANIATTMGLMFCGISELESESLEYVWTVSEIVFNEYIEDIYVEAESYIQRLAPRNDDPVTANWKMRKPIKTIRTFQQKSRSPVVLIVVATESENSALMELSGLSEVAAEDRSFAVGNQTCVDLGFRGLVVWATMCAPGAEGTLGSQATVSDLITDISKKRKIAAIIMPGIAFGLDRDEQRMGDVLLSRQIKLYEPSKIAGGRKEYERPIIPEADSFLVSAFRQNIPSWEKQSEQAGNDDRGPKVHSGLFLSGSKLINDKHKVFKLKQDARHAIGGEMEGAGVYSASARANKPWIIVKAICDWGMDKGDDYQDLAAKNSIDFVFSALRTNAFADWLEGQK